MDRICQSGKFGASDRINSEKNCISGVDPLVLGRELRKGRKFLKIRSKYAESFNLMITTEVTKETMTCSHFYLLILL
uniref:Uncharacterized protein n=1 Tax=Caenorhabditis tropicalis TaxID=1561998 RepID=A0A1I7UIN9_9PELO